MIKKISFFCVLAVLLSLFSQLQPTGAALSARGYALVEQTTGRLIDGGNTELRLPMASTTKIMTGLLACESGRLDEMFTVPAEALLVEGSSMYLSAGEKLTLRDITYGLLLASGNDAANTIAFLLDGSLSAFADRMNRRAAELSLTGTHFDNPSGLDGPTHYTTALDLARLGAAAMKNPDFRTIVSTYKIRIPYKGIANGRLLVNHNELLNIYSGTVGIKTGYTKKSGRCLVSCAERGGITLVAATLNGRDDFNDHIALLSEGFKLLKIRPLFDPALVITANVVGGNSSSAGCSFDDSLTAALKDGERDKLMLQVNMRRFYYAPVSKGEKLGELVVMLDGTELARTGIYATEDNTGEKPNRIKDFWLSLF